FARPGEARDTMLAALLPRCRNWREQGADAMDPEEFEVAMPEVSSPLEFDQLVGLSNVHVLGEALEHIAYIGFELGCTWDREHGLGFMTHAQRGVDVGGADTAFLEWVAMRDIKKGGGGV